MSVTGCAQCRRDLQSRSGDVGAGRRRRSPNRRVAKAIPTRSGSPTLRRLSRAGAAKFTQVVENGAIDNGGEPFDNSDGSFDSADLPIDKAQALIAKPCTLIDKSDLPIANRLNPVDNPLMVIDSQRTVIDSGDLVIFSQSTPVDNGDDSIAKAFNPVHGANNLIAERRKRVAILCGPSSKTDGSVVGKSATVPQPAGTVCKPNLLIAKVGLAIAVRYKPVAMRVPEFITRRSYTHQFVGGCKVMEVASHGLDEVFWKSLQKNLFSRKL